MSIQQHTLIYCTIFKKGLCFECKYRELEGTWFGVFAVLKTLVRQQNHQPTAENMAAMAENDYVKEH